MTARRRDVTEFRKALALMVLLLGVIAVLFLLLAAIGSVVSI